MKGAADKREYERLADSLRVRRIGECAAELSWADYGRLELTEYRGRPRLRRRSRTMNQGKWVMRRGKLQWVREKTDAKQKEKKKRINRFGKLVKQAHHKPRPEVMPDSDTLSAALYTGAKEAVEHLLAKHAKQTQ